MDLHCEGNVLSVLDHVLWVLIRLPPWKTISSMAVEPGDLYTCSARAEVVL